MSATRLAASPPASLLRRIAWTTLLGLLLALAIPATLGERLGGETLVAGEATLLMQASSLAYDLDLTFEREDFDRLVLRWGGEPPDLALASEDGAPIVFDRPFPLALYLAPFVRIWPQRGFALANLLLLAGVAVFAARQLDRLVGESAALWVAAWLFASVTFVYVFLALPGIFLFATTVLGVGLAARAYPPPPGTQPAPEIYGDDVVARRDGVARLWLAAGAVLALPSALAPEMLAIALGLWLVAPAQGRRAARTGLIAGLSTMLALQVVVHFLAGGGFLFAGAERFVFTPATGFPLVDFTAAEWSSTVPRLAAMYWHEAPRLYFGFDAGLWGWNLLYLLCGRHIGLLPYFAPLLALLLVGSRSSFRGMLLWVAGLWLLYRVVLHPFDLFGGPGAVANRHFLPMFGALLWVIARPPRRMAAAATTMGIVALAGCFLYPLWSTPGDPLRAEGGESHVGYPARRWLPYETSQRWLPGGQVAEHAGLWVRFLDHGGWPETGPDRLMLAGEQSTRIHLVSPIEPRPLEVLRLELGDTAPSQLEVDGGEVGERFLRPDGGIGFRVRLDGMARRHPVWWSPQRHDHRVLELRFPAAPGEPVMLRLVPEVLLAPGEESSR